MDKSIASDMTVVIPAYNEVEVVGDVIRELLQQIPDLQVIVVDDGSLDGTAEAALAAGAKVVSHTKNKGYGAALKTGIRAANTEYVAMYDADGQHRPEDLAALAEVARTSDIVIGARGSESHQALSRIPGKWVLAKIANYLVGETIPDLNSGLRVIRRRIFLRYLHLLPDGFSASTTSTICFIKRKYDVKFVPITTRKRVGKSTVKQFRDGFRTIGLILRLIMLFSPSRVFVPPAIALIIAGILYGLTKAIIVGLGIPTLAAVLVLSGLFTGMFGLLADQISTLRIEIYERDRDAPDR